MNGFSRALCMAAMAAFVSACAPARVPLYLHPEWSPGELEEIVLLPIADRRADMSEELDLEESLRAPARSELEDKGYRVRELPFPDGMDSIDVAELTDDELSDLVPEGAAGVLVVFLEDLRDEYGWKFIWLTYEFDIEVSGKLLDGDGKVVWFDRGMQTRRGGGLLEAPLTQGAAKVGAYSAAVDQLLQTLPGKN